MRKRSASSDALRCPSNVTVVLSVKRFFETQRCTVELVAVLLGFVLGLSLLNLFGSNT